jgi:predicted O-methyltransferase YrrM
MIYRSRNSEKPWLTPEANRILEDLLRPEDVGIEFGSGKSTLWFSRAIAQLTSIEHDASWYGRVSAWLQQEGVANVDYRCVPMEDADEEDGLQTRYAGQLHGFADESLDFALVDGVYRSACANVVIPKLRPGGVLVVDNVNWFLPSATIAPSSRGLEDGPASALWHAFSSAVQGWRRIWTTSGVTDTAFFLKPTATPVTPIVA